MIVSLLKDAESHEVDAVIVSYETTPKEIQEIIDRVKAEKEYDYQFDDLKDALPKDCTMFEKWNELIDHSVYY